jgi:type IV secretion system protein VirB10
MTEERPRGETEIARELRLRPAPPRVTRLSPKALTALGAAAGLGIGGALLFALQTRDAGTPAELYNIDRKPTADGLATLPRDYAGLPRSVPPLGPPLPGDLGRPIVSAQQRGQPVPAPGVPPAPTVDPAEQRRLQEMEAARVSRLFVRTEGPAAASLSAVGPGDPAAPGERRPADEAFAQNGQDRKLAFLNAAVDRRTVSPDRVRAPASPYVVQAGNVIPAALVTGLRSDLPGQVVAQVTENVYDSPTGRFLLIPQGSRLVGQYDAQVSFGQSRVLLVWTRLLLPNGRSIVLERQPGADGQGHAGLEDGVDYHWGRLFMAAGLATLLGVATELGQDDEDEIARAIRESGQDTIGRAGDQLVRRQMNVQPTLTVRPGFPVRVIVTRDLVLEPYRS